MYEDEGGKHLMDAGMAGVLLAVLNQWLPAIASLLTILWVMLRFWESETVRGWTKRKIPVQTVYVVRDSDQDEDEESLDPAP